MTPVLDLVFLNNTVRTWIVAGGVAVGGYLLLTILLALVRTRLGKLAARTKTPWDDIFVLALAFEQEGIQFAYTEHLAMTRVGGSS